MAAGPGEIAAGNAREIGHDKQCHTHHARAFRVKSDPPMNRFMGDCHHCRYVHRASQPSRGKCLACPAGRSGERGKG